MKKYGPRHLPSVLVLSVLTLLASFRLPATAEAEPVVSQDALIAATHQCASFLVRSVEPDGQFSPDLGKTPGPYGTPQYSISAHAGALFALVSYQQHYPETNTFQAIQRAADYLLREATQPLPHISDAITILPYPKSAAIATTTAERLPCSASGLCALAAYAGLEPALAHTNVLRGLGHFLRLEEREDGSFNAPPGGTLNSMNPLAQFSPGEAALALQLLNDFTRNSEWLMGARTALFRTARQRDQNKTPHDDPWSLYASAKLLKSRETMLDPAMRRLLWQDTRTYCQERLRQQQQLPSAVNQAGALTSSASISNTALVLAGLLSALTILPEGEQPLRENTLQACERGINFIIEAQVSKGPHHGAFPRIPPHGKASSPGDAMPDPTIHIIEAQNALIALILYDQATGANWL